MLSYCFKMKKQINIRVGNDVAQWLEKHPLSTNALVNYGLHLLMQMEANINKANVYISTVTVSPPKENLPF